MISVEVQRACAAGGLPPQHQMRAWIAHAVVRRRKRASIGLRLVDAAEGAALNERWRGKSGPTNVLSFPASGLEKVAPEILGDIVLCVPVLKAEARAQRKTIAAHCAHLLVHGSLHLLGMDHQDEAQARRMEQLERRLLAELGFPDPYATAEDHD